MSANSPRWTKAERDAADHAIAYLKREIQSLDDLLTDEERDSLNADLAEMVRIRRRAEVASAQMEMP